MLAYVEVPTFPLPTMMALAAAGTFITSAHSLKALQLASENIEVSVDLIRFNHNTFVPTTPVHGTFHGVAACIQNSMHVNDTHGNHHDQHQPVDLTAIHCKIQHTTAWWNSFISTLNLAQDACLMQPPMANANMFATTISTSNATITTTMIQMTRQRQPTPALLAPTMLPCQTPWKH